MQEFINKIIQGDVRKQIKLLPDDSVDCCVTSPPYWGLRDYGCDGQMGLEETPEEFIGNMALLFRDIRRVLKPTGTLWLNIGDSYCSTAPGTYSAPLRQDGILSGVSEETSKSRISFRNKTPLGLKPKDLVGIPWMLAFALRNEGFYLRQDIIWHKPNPMPESVTDRCTKSHEYIFLLSKSSKYYYDAEAILEPCSPNTHARLSQDVMKQIGSARANGGKKTNGNMKAVSRKHKNLERNDPHSFHLARIKDNDNFNSALALPVLERNKRSVWTVTTESFSEAHFATFPQDLISDCIKAGCPENGIVLDPFMGAGTTAVVAKKLNRNYIGFELNSDYIKIAEKRLYKELGMFL